MSYGRPAERAAPAGRAAPAAPVGWAAAAARAATCTARTVRAAGVATAATVATAVRAGRAAVAATVATAAPSPCGTRTGTTRGRSTRMSPAAPPATVARPGAPGLPGPGGAGGGPGTNTGNGQIGESGYSGSGGSFGSPGSIGGGGGRGQNGTVTLIGTGLTTLSADKTVYEVGQSAVYTVSGKPNHPILWSSWKDGVSTGEVDANYGQVTDAAGNWTGTLGPWQPGDLSSNYEKQAKVDGKTARIRLEIVPIGSLTRWGGWNSLQGVDGQRADGRRGNRRAELVRVRPRQRQFRALQPSPVLGPGFVHLLRLAVAWRRTHLPPGGCRARCGHRRARRRVRPGPRRLDLLPAPAALAGLLRGLGEPGRLHRGRAGGGGREQQPAHGVRPRRRQRALRQHL